MGIEDGLRHFHYGLCLMPSWGLWRNGCEIEVSLRQQRLLAVLAVHGTCRRELIAGMLWPESPESSALDNLRVSIHRVTSGLPNLIHTNRHVLELSEWVGVDLHREWEALEGTAGPGNDKPPGTTPCCRAGTKTGCSTNRSGCYRPGPPIGAGPRCSAWPATTTPARWNRRPRGCSLMRWTRLRWKLWSLRSWPWASVFRRCRRLLDSAAGPGRSWA